MPLKDVFAVTCYGVVVEMVMMGDVELIVLLAFEEGVRFAIRAGGYSVGSGVVTSVLR